MATNLIHIRKFKCPLNAPQLFQPVASVYLSNLTYEEQLLGMCKKINEIIDLVNQFEEIIEEFPNLVEDITKSLNLLEQDMIRRDQLVLAASKVYTDQKIKVLADKVDELQVNAGPIYDPTTGLVSPVQVVMMNVYEYTRDDALTAEQYDMLQLTAAQYDNYGLTAIQYDQYAKKLL